MDLTINGTWTEETNSAGYYQGSTHHGAFQLLSDPTGRPASPASGSASVETST